MSDNFKIRQANRTDLGFIIDAVIASDKSGTSKSGLSYLFGVAEEELRKLIAQMFEEEVDGCEYSYSSYLIAEEQGKAVTTLAGWVEGAEDDMPSGMLKSNLIAYTLSKQTLEVFTERVPCMGGLQLSRDIGALQVECVYTDSAFRGKGHFVHLMNELILRSSKVAPTPMKAQVQFFANNKSAERAYSKAGFSLAGRTKTDDKRILENFPDIEKVLYERKL